MIGRLRRGYPVAVLKSAWRAGEDAGASLRSQFLPGWRPRVAFEVYSPFGFSAQAPVIEALLRRGRVTVALAGGAERDVDGARLADLEAMGVELVPLLALRHRRFDAIVITDRAQVRSWRSTRLVYLHHGSGFAYTPRSYAFRLLEEREFGYLLSLHSDEQALAEEMFGPSLEGRIRVVGQPKVDRLVRASTQPATLTTDLGLAPGRKTVLVASHWTPASLLRTCGEAILTYLAMRDDLNVLVTAHPHVWGRAEARTGGVDWRARLAWVAQYPHLRLLPGAEAVDLMPGADLLVGDHSSVVLEYAILRRPILVYRDPGQSFQARRLEQLLEASAVLFRTPEEFPDRLQDALRITTPEPVARQRLLDASFAMLGQSAEAAAEAIEDVARYGRL